MHVESMKDFLVFSRFMSVGRAARMLGVPQPTLSYRISKLEKELGFDLTDHAQRPHLTAGGKTFVSYAEQIVALYDDMLKESRDIMRGSESSLIFERPIAFDQSRRDIDALCAEFTALADASIQFKESDELLYDVLEAGEADVGLIWTHPEHVESEMDGFGRTFLPRVGYPKVSFYMRKDNPLAAKGCLSSRDLDGQKVVLPLSIRYATLDEVALWYAQYEHVNLRIIHKQGSYRDIELGLARDEIAFSMEDLGDPDHVEREFGLVSSPAEGDAWASRPYLVYLISNDKPVLERLLEYVESLADGDSEA